MSKNKVLIMAYQEGASGLNDGGRKFGDFALSRMVSDANTAADAFAAMGVEPYVCDVYGVGREIFKNGLTPNAKRISISEVPELCESGEVFGAVMTGAHAMNGAPHAFMSFTVNETAWFEYRLNGKPMGDVGLGAAFLGAFGVPVIALTGDKAACLEAKAFLGELPCAEVKSAQIRNWSKCLPDAESQALIEQTVKTAYEEVAKRKPFVAQMPCNVSVTFCRADFADDCIMYNDGRAKRISPLVCEKTVEKIKNYGDLRI